MTIFNKIFPQIVMIVDHRQDSWHVFSLHVTCFSICWLQTELLQAARRIRSGPPLGVQREAPVGEVAVSRESNKMAEAPLPRLSVNPAPQLPPRKKQEPTKQNPDLHWDMYVFRIWHNSGVKTHKNINNRYENMRVEIFVAIKMKINQRMCFFATSILL